MKKIYFLIIFLFFGVNFSFAKDINAFCSLNSPNRTFGGNILSISGLNFLSRNIIENRISAIIKKETNSKMKIDLNGFYGTNILKGEFKSLKAQSDKFSYSGFYFSDLNIKTLCSYNYISLDKKELLFKENMVFEYSTNITQDDLNKISNSDEYKKIIKKMNQNKSINSLFEIQNSNFEIRNDKLYLKYTVLPIFIKKPIKLTISTNLRARNGKIELYNLSSKNKFFDIAPIINFLNPMQYWFDIDTKNKGELVVQNVQIKDKKILIQGNVFIPKTE